VTDTELDQLHDAIQLAGGAPGAGGLLVGWVVLSAWAGADGEHYSNMRTPETQPPWTTDGLLHHALYEAKPPDEGEDDD